MAPVRKYMLRVEMIRIIQDYNYSIYEFETTFLSQSHNFSGGEYLVDSFYIKTVLSPCGSMILSTSSNGNLYMWELGRQSAEPLIFLGHRKESTGIAWSNYSPETVATCSDDMQVIIWDIERDEALLSRKKQENLICGFVDPYSVNCVPANLENGICKQVYYGTKHGFMSWSNCPKSVSIVGDTNQSYLVDSDPVWTKEQLSWVLADKSNLQTPRRDYNYMNIDKPNTVGENSKGTALKSSPSNVGENSKGLATKVKRRQSTLSSGTKIQPVKKRQSKTGKINDTTPSITNYFKLDPK
jgi:hypothetical protein